METELDTAGFTLFADYNCTREYQIERAVRALEYRGHRVFLPKRLKAQIAYIELSGIFKWVEGDLLIKY